MGNVVTEINYCFDGELQISVWLQFKAKLAMKIIGTISKQYLKPE